MRYKKLELDRYKKEHWKNILAGNGPYDFSVIDLVSKKEYPADLGEHWGVMLEIIKQNYSDEFKVLSDEQKDDFILATFKLIGKSYQFGYYTDKLKEHVEQFGYR